MQIVVQQTPNPNALKFVLPATRFAGPANFPSAEAAEQQPLAKQLFNLGGIYNVFWAQDFVTVNKYPDVPWEPLTERILAILSATSQDTGSSGDVMSLSARTPVIVASENGRRGAVAAMDLLRNGGSALDAVELACRIVEDDPEEHSVGYSGLPNVVGQVELDASIMDGRTLETGAVAALHGYGNAITLARRVMEQLPHVLVVGRGAEQLAAELNHSPTNQLTEEALRRWRQRYEEYGLNPTAPADLRKVANTLTRPVNLRDLPVENKNLDDNGKDDTLGTVNFLALDQRGDIASAVSTSGLAWKYPGRVGDSPIIGAGNYCDNRYGAVGCTGMGELAIRVSTARSIILYMKMGMSLEEAGMEALRDLSGLKASPGQYMNIVTLAPDGSHLGFTTVPGKKYLYVTADMDEPALADRLMLPEG